jgi:hypothetical protein
MTVDSSPQVADVLVVLDEFNVPGGWVQSADDPLAIEPTVPVSGATVFSAAHIAQAWQSSTGCRPVTVAQLFAIGDEDRSVSWRIRFEAVL